MAQYAWQAIYTTPFYFWCCFLHGAEQCMAGGNPHFWGSRDRVFPVCFHTAMGRIPGVKFTTNSVTVERKPSKSCRASSALALWGAALHRVELLLGKAVHKFPSGSGARSQSNVSEEGIKCLSPIFLPPNTQQGVWRTDLMPLSQTQLRVCAGWGVRSTGPRNQPPLQNQKACPLAFNWLPNVWMMKKLSVFTLKT